MDELDFLAVIRVLQSLSLGGISLAVLVVILTEVTKEFSGIEGKAVRAVALGYGFILTAIAYGIAEGLIPEAAAPYIQWVFVSLAGAFGGMGLWHLGKRFLSREPDQAKPYKSMFWDENVDGLVGDDSHAELWDAPE